VWENSCACVRCNGKGGRTPQEAGIKLIKKPYVLGSHYSRSSSAAKYASWKTFLDKRTGR
jgi:hypothetical protein